jgi:hypothetical protein
MDHTTAEGGFMPLPRDSMGDLFAPYSSSPAAIEAAAGRIAGWSWDRPRVFR